MKSCQGCSGTSHKSPRRPGRIKVKAKYAVAVLLKQWLNLHLDQDGILCCHTTHRKQLLLFKELPQDLGHLGVERMLDLF